MDHAKRDALTLTEAHRLTEAARSGVRAAVLEVTEILFHREPEGHADGYSAHRAPLRPEIEAVIRAALAHHLPNKGLDELHLTIPTTGCGVRSYCRGRGAIPTTTLPSRMPCACASARTRGFR